jgi:DNA invertase Pin-like site-specific DNA recombinase
MKIISYYRVSTQRQGQSGLGLQAQQAKVHQLATERHAQIVAEYTEIESGRKNHRPQLNAALNAARELNAIIAVAKLDRLARDCEFVLRLSREAELNGIGGFLFADLPDIDCSTSAGRLILTIMGSIAEFEARRISERTRDALNAAKERGRELGSNLPRQRELNADRARRAQEAAEKLAPIIVPLRQRGDSLASIAEALNASGVRTTGGGDRWQPMTVKRALARIGAM